MQSISISKWMVDLQNKLSNYNNILILSSKSFRERGQLDILETSLPGKNLFILDNINSLPTIHEIDSHYALLKKLPFEFEIIVALGGGSVIDSSKCIAYLLASNTQLSLARVIESAKTDTNTYALPIIAIPTTAGTGSEATSFATVWDSDLKVKKSLENISIKPLVYIHDFNLLKTLSRENFLLPMLDATSHSLESIWNTSATEFSIQKSMEALRLIIPNLSSNFSEFTDLAFSQVQKGSFLAGEAIEHTRTSISHAISYPITAYFKVPHGLAASFTLPKILKYYLQNHSSKNIDKKLLKNAQEALIELNLTNMLNQYCTYDQILTLIPKMHHSGRSDKFVAKVDQNLIKKFL